MHGVEDEVRRAVHDAAERPDGIEPLYPLVAYHDYNNGHRMMVRDIFDENGYYYELALDIQSLSISVISCEQDEETGELTVTYSYGDNSTEYTATLPTVS